MNKFLLIIPIYNEEKVLESVAHNTVKEAKEQADILFINDGSYDRSPEILLSLQKQYPFIKLLNKEVNEGYGASIISGFNYGIQEYYDYLITMDCDAQHEPKDLHRFFTYNPYVDVVSGSRYLKDSQIVGKAPEDRVEINYRITELLNETYNWSLSDAFCGYKRYRIDAFKNHGFEEKGYAFPLELWAFAYRNHLHIEELAVDRIYLTNDRSFGEDLDNKNRRYRHYMQAWKKAEEKYGIER
ncbi:MAG: glycosyltransferase family 2 protein [Leptospiraceae bacterium]|nr:glycosyltransferase family 2 protein [Leptospiraceae bacterium]MCP5499058.1 glycosyltransferase family 2 protein [Leptospiraceae bacterium]